MIKVIEGQGNGDISERRSPDDDEPFSALVFKIATDPYVGTLSFLEFTPVSCLQVIRFSILSRSERKGSVDGADALE